MIKERPIIFNSDMIRAILDGRKTQTRRPLKKQPTFENGLWKFSWGAGCSLSYLPVMPVHATENVCPFGKIGDGLWVRETWAKKDDNFHDDWPRKDGESDIYYKADDPFNENDGLPKGLIKWRPSIHMPRWASRITLEITNVRVERLQEITHKDALLEGVKYNVSEIGGAPLPRFQKLWNSIYGPGAWERNDWVWVVEFKALTTWGLRDEVR